MTDTKNLQKEIEYLKSLLTELAGRAFTQATDVLALIAQKIEELEREA